MNLVPPLEVPLLTSTLMIRSVPLPPASAPWLQGLASKAARCRPAGEKAVAKQASAAEDAVPLSPKRVSSGLRWRNGFRASSLPAEFVLMTVRARGRFHNKLNPALA